MPRNDAQCLNEYFKSDLRKALSVACLSAFLATSFAPYVRADVSNPAIPVSKRELWEKCQRSGGEFTEDGGRGFKCVVINPDTIVTVDCDGWGACSGTIEDIDRKVRQNRFMVTGFGANNTLANPLADQ